MIEIKQETYFPLGFKVVAFFFIAKGALLWTDLFRSPISESMIYWALLGVPMVVIGILIISAHHRLKIDVQGKNYGAYLWLLGFKVGKPEKFDFISKIYINSVIESRAVTSRQSGVRSVAKKRIHVAYMKLSDGKKIKLDTDNSRIVLEQRVDTYIIELNGVYRPS